MGTFTCASGDLIVIEGLNGGDSHGIGEILEVLGAAEAQRYPVRWDDGREHLHPGGDTVIRHAQQAGAIDEP